MSVIALLFHKIGDTGVETDFYWSYAPQAKEILNGTLLIDAYKGPVYQIVLAGTGFLLGGDFFNAGTFISLISASLVLMFIFKIVELISKSEIALFTVILVATNKYFVKYSYSCCTDLLFMVLFFAALYYIIRSNFTDVKKILIAGLCCSLAYLTRYTGIALMMGVMLYVSFHIAKKLFKAGKTITEPSGNKTGKILLFFVPCIVLVLLWGAICYFQKGTFFYNDNFLNTAYTVYKPPEMSNADWVTQHQSEFHSMFDVIFTDFSLFFKRIFVENFTSYFVNDMSVLVPWYAGILSSAGLLLLSLKIKKSGEKEKLFFMFSFIFYLFTIMIFYSERFSLPLLPFYYFLLLKVFFFDYSSILSISRRRAALAALIVVIAMTSANIYNSYNYAAKDFEDETTQLLPVIDWVKKNYDDKLKDKTVLCRKPNFAYYTGSKFAEMLRVTSVDALVSVVKKTNADYVLMDSREFTDEGRKIMKPLFLGEIYPDILELLVAYKNIGCALYRVKK